MAIRQILMSDAQTSGGLIISIDSSKASILLEKIKKDSIYEAVIIGTVINRESSSTSIKVSL